MPVAWPPPTAPAWPPVGHSSLEFSDLAAAEQFAAEVGWTYRAPTSQEQRAYFRDARCDDGHQVTGAMLVTPRAAYPFAVCLGSAFERVFLVLWPPFVWGSV